MNYNDSYIGLRYDLLKYVKGDSIKVMDVGCALGINGKYLLENNFAVEVVGVEFDENMALEADKYNSKVFCGDLNDEDFIEILIKESSDFDYIIFGDVLEHLYNPLKVLTNLKSLLKSNGQILISLPNIGHIELFIQIYIKGSWPNNDRGIFDKTHLRWFTKKDAVNLVNFADLKVVEYERKFRARDAIGSEFNWKTKLLKFISKDLVTFQHIMVCKHA